VVPRPPRSEDGVEIETITHVITVTAATGDGTTGAPEEAITVTGTTGSTDAPRWVIVVTVMSDVTSGAMGHAITA